MSFCSFSNSDVCTLAPFLGLNPAVISAFFSFLLSSFNPALDFFEIGPVTGGARELAGAASFGGAASLSFGGFF